MRPIFNNESDKYGTIICCLNLSTGLETVLLNCPWLQPVRALTHAMIDNIYSIAHFLDGGSGIVRLVPFFTGANLYSFLKRGTMP